MNERYPNGCVVEHAGQHLCMHCRFAPPPSPAADAVAEGEMLGDEQRTQVDELTFPFGWRRQVIGITRQDTVIQLPTEFAEM